MPSRMLLTHVSGHSDTIRNCIHMTIRDIIREIERRAPLRYQDGFDNSGLQVGLDLGRECRRVSVCLDVTEEVVDEALERGCELLVSHHPLLFHPLRQVTLSTYQERCVVKALRGGLAIYSAHTSLDNAPGGVNFRIAELIGLEGCEWLEPKEGMDAGSGLVGCLPAEETPESLLGRLKDIFKVERLVHSDPALVGRIGKVALCGGAGAFLLPQARAKGAQCFITGELHYHDFFGPGLLLVEMGHYQSEQYTMDLIRDIISGAFPSLDVSLTSVRTNPERYL